MILLRFISISEYEGSIILILEKDTGSNQYLKEIKSSGHLKPLIIEISKPSKIDTPFF